jgi:hypothetical protein
MLSAVELELDSFHKVLTPRYSFVHPASPQHKKLRIEHKKRCGFVGEEYFAYSFSVRKVDLHIKQYNKKCKSGT